MGVWIEMNVFPVMMMRLKVTPFMGVWIEIFGENVYKIGMTVTPFMGVWIEIKLEKPVPIFLLSLPLWECGLKLNTCHNLN